MHLQRHSENPLARHPQTISTTTTKMTTTDITTTDTTAMILYGNGYTLEIAPDAAKQKTELLALAEMVTTVTDNDESAKAQFVSRKLAAMRIAVEKSRKEVKEPVNKIGKLIDSTAKDFVAEIEREEKRITALVGHHAAEVARRKAEKEREERRLMEEARAAREAEEAAKAKAESTSKISDVIAAKQAEKERMAALAARMEVSEEVANEQVASGVRFAWDFEVIDIAELYRHEPDLVSLAAKTSLIIAALKELETEGLPVEIPGIRAFKKPVVSSR
jgi:hypothetical protein